MIMIFHIFISIFSARLKLIFVREIFFFYCFLLMLIITIFSIVRSIEHIARKKKLNFNF